MEAKRVGQIETVTKVARWHTCDKCNTPASHRVTFLLSNTWQNPASSAYGQGDCSWCSDLDMYTCRTHLGGIRQHPPRGYELCASMELRRLKQMGFYWVTVGKARGGE